MKKGLFKQILTALMTVSLLSLSACAARPPKPGPHFIWVPKHVNKFGKPVPGYWKHTGPRERNRVWFNGHYDSNGVWVRGAWRALP